MSESQGIPFKLERWDLNFLANFKEPQFGLFDSASALSRTLFAKLSSHGLRLADMRITGRGDRLADLALECSLFDFTTTLKIRLNAVELQGLDACRTTRQHLLQVAVDACESVPLLAAGASFETLSVVLSFHGTLAGIAPKGFLARFTMNPPAIAPLLSTGAIFYYGPHAKRVSAWVALEQSNAVEEGIFVRSHAIWDGTKTSLRDLLVDSEQHVHSVLAGCGLVPSAA